MIVPGWADPAVEPSRALTDALAHAHARGARVVSLCTGAFVLAAAGLLDGRRATTHWLYAERLRERCPTALLAPEVLYVGDGSVFTSAGTAAGIDLCLHLVALDHGAEAAAAVARRIVVPLHRAGGQAQYADLPITRDPQGLSDLLDWAAASLGTGLTVDGLATRGAMSTRTLTRRFRAAVGMPPGEWLHRERLRLARRLLEQTDDPIGVVARRAGYESAATMRAQFSARLDTSPRAYRVAFRAQRSDGRAAARR